MTAKPDPDPMTFYLGYKKPFDFEQILSFMAPRAIKGVEVVTQASYGRTFRIGPAKGFLEVTDRPERAALAVQVGCKDTACHTEICSRVRRMFDLDTDFGIINRRFATDERLSRGMASGQVPRLPVAFDPFEFVVRAVLGQQISVKAATTLAARVAGKAAVETGAGFPEGLAYFFPTPVELLNLDLDGLGVTRTRQATIKTTVQSILKRELALTADQSFERFYTDFAALKGIGDWTVNYVAMRGLGMVDSFPAGDLGVARALSRQGRMPTRKEIAAIAEDWRPYRAYAALCLWNQ